MPINKEEFERGKLHSKVEDKIVSFLKERKEGAFTSQEIMGGILVPIVENVAEKTLTPFLFV